MRRPPPSRQAGTLSEVIPLQWSLIYAWTGWLWGATIDWPWPGAIGGFAMGMAIGSAARGAALFEATGLAFLAALVAWLLVPRSWLPHVAAAICAVPVACLLFLSARDSARKARARRLAEEAGTLDALIPLLQSKDAEVCAAACARLGGLELPTDGRARAILQVASRMDDPVGEPEWLKALAAPLAHLSPPPREALLLLYEHLGWVSAGQWGPEENCDRWIQDILFDRLQWNDDGPLRRASQTRMEKGWNVDRMVARLLDTDPEVGARMAESAFPVGALSADMLLRLDEARAAPVIEREIARAMTTKIERYDRILEAALGLAPGRAFTLLERVLEWDPAEYSIEGIFEGKLLKGTQPGLDERCARAPSEAARFLAAVRVRIAWLERYDWNAKFSPGWHPKARLVMWSALADALEARRGGT